MKIKDGVPCIKCDGYCYEGVIDFDIEGKNYSCEAFICEFCQEPILDTSQMRILLNMYQENKKKAGMIRKRKEKTKIQKCKRYAIEQVEGFSSVFKKTKGE